MEILNKEQELKRYIRSIAKQVVRESRDIERNTGIRYKSWLKAGLVIGILVGAVAFFSGCCAASQIPRDQAIKAIIGEAENQGFHGMLAVACGIRNRNTLQGVYGLKAARVRNHQYNSTTLNQANLAWSLASNSDIKDNCDFLGGATHWDNINAFGKPNWANSMIETYRYRDHVFYRKG